MEDCVFCRIVRNEVPAQVVHRDEEVLVFRDINPKAPVHLLLIPREHIPSLAEATPEHERLLGRLLLTAREVARAQGLHRGYRLVNNCGDEGGQTVPHLHFHLLGGRFLGWPPG